MAKNITLKAENLKTLRTVNPRLLSYNVEMTEVTDIKLQETELAEIVKEIYNHGSAAKENGGN